MASWSVCGHPFFEHAHKLEQKMGEDGGQMLPGGANANERLLPEWKRLRI
jgi:hypothetical protein